MTSGNVNNFVSDLVLMAKAMEELPQIKAEFETVSALLNEERNTVQSREEAILKLKAEIDALHTTTRRLEAERDDAELRFLEADDRTGRALDFIKTTFGSAGSVIQSLEPPAKVEPVIPAPPAEAEIKFEPHEYTEPVKVTVFPQDGGSIKGQVASDGTFTPGDQEDVVRTEEDVRPSPIPMDGRPIPGNGNGDPTAADATTGQGAADPTSSASEPAAIAETSPASLTVTATEGVSVPSSPTSAPVAQTGTGMEPDASGSEDVGYHNEPSEKFSELWYSWAKKMDRKFDYNWGKRPTA